MRATKPDKPYKDFPLTAHPNGTWVKKIKGKLYGFGGWANPQAALAKYEHDRDALQAGRDPDPMPGDEQITLYDLVDEFLSTKEKRVEIGKLSRRMHFDYVRSCERVCNVLGRTRIVEALKPKDFDNLYFELAKDKDGKPVSSVTLANRVRTARILFKFASDQELIPKPLKFGQNFKLPGRDELRQARTLAGEKMFEAGELRAILELLSQPVNLTYRVRGTADVVNSIDKATGEPITRNRSPVFRAMTLLGINCGFGQNDCATLPISTIDLAGGWIKFPRPKTHVERRCPLWPETVEALRISLAERPEPKDEQFSGLAFLTTSGQPYVRIGDKGAALDAIAGEFDKVRKKLKITGRRSAFYSLRRTFETIASDTQDQTAIDLIMGHAAASNDMAAVYRQRVDDARLKAVTDHVRAWLWPQSAKSAKKTKAPAAKVKVK